MSLLPIPDLMLDSIYELTPEMLTSRGVRFVYPETGRLACGDVGEGKLAPVEQIVEEGKAIIPWVSNTFTFCLFCVLPFNLIKGVIVSVIVAIIYKPLSRLIHKGIE